MKGYVEMFSGAGCCRRQHTIADTNCVLGGTRHFRLWKGTKQADNSGWVAECVSTQHVTRSGYGSVVVRINRYACAPKRNVK